MIIKETHGDLIKMFKRGDLDIDGIAHGCNCQNLMSAGIALDIHKEFPAAFFADVEYYRQYADKLGYYSQADVLDGKKVYNLYTQLYPGPNAKYEHVYNAFEELNSEFYYSSYRKIIGIPLIGCGIGGLDWNVVKNIINDTSSNFDIIVVHFKKEETCNNSLLTLI